MNCMQSFQNLAKQRNFCHEGVSFFLALIREKKKQSSIQNILLAETALDFLLPYLAL